MIQLLQKIILSLMLMLIGVSCTKEDVSLCESSLLLSFHYTYNIENEDMFLSSIEYIELFVYNKSSELVQNYKIGKTDLIDGNKYRLQLRQGTYQIVAHGEVRTSYIYHGIDSPETAYISVTRDAGNRVPSQLDNMFHAMKQDITITNSEQEQHLFFAKNSNHIRVIVRDELSVKASNAVTCDINAINGDYKFDNTIYGNDRVHYTPTSEVVGCEQMFDFTVLRLWQGDDSKLIVQDQSMMLYNGSLSELLLRKPGTDLEIQDTFEIVLLRDSQNSTVKITVNGWEVIDHNSGL